MADQGNSERENDRGKDMNLEEDVDKETIATDQYHHFVPRFILKKFAQRCQNSGDLTVWNWWTGSHQVRAVKSTFGMFNLYDSVTNRQASNEKVVEKLFADLECDTGRIFKKVEEGLARGKDELDALASVHLSESEIYTVYKFIALSGFRNGPGRLCLDFTPKGPVGPAEKKVHEEWLEQLKFLLKNSHQDLAAMDELLQPHLLRPLLARYKQMSLMKLLFWTTPKGEEFLLSNLLIGLEGYLYPKAEGTSCTIGLPSHLYVPIGPEILVVLCGDSLCKQSMLHSAPHGATSPYNRPAKGKLGKTDGRRRYQAIVPNWKTTYPITTIFVDDVSVINGYILAVCNIVVYKSLHTLNKAVDNVIPFSKRRATWHRYSQQSAFEAQGEKEERAGKLGDEVLMLVLAMTRASIRRIVADCDEDLQEEVMAQTETLEKIIWHMFCQVDDPRMLSMLCKPGSYFMGHRKGF